MYVKQRGNSPVKIYRYCVNSTPSYCAGQQGQWAVATTWNATRNAADFQAIVYDPELNGGTLLFYNGSGYSTGCGGLHGYREGVGWSVISEANCPLDSGYYSTLAVYSTVKKLAYFGGGSGSTHFWKVICDDHAGGRRTLCDEHLKWRFYTNVRRPSVGQHHHDWMHFGGGNVGVKPHGSAGKPMAADCRESEWSRPDLQCQAPGY